MALYGLVWPCMALFGLVWPCMALFGLFMVAYGILWSFLVVIDPNSFGLVHAWNDKISCKILKLHYVHPSQNRLFIVCLLGNFGQKYGRDHKV